MKTITISELHDATKSLTSNDLILDVRTPGEFAAGRVPNAKNIPVDQVMKHAEELKKYSSVYVYCLAGGRVVATYNLLAPFGVKNLICVDEGGFPDWAEAGYPIEK